MKMKFLEFRLIVLKHEKLQNFWIASFIGQKYELYIVRPEKPVQGVGDFLVVGRGMVGVLERDTEVPMPSRAHY